MAKENYNRRRAHNHKRSQSYKNNSEQMVEMPLWFAKTLMRQITYDPQNATAKKSRSYSVYTKENLIKWLQSPTSTSNEKSLRDASNYIRG